MMASPGNAIVATPATETALMTPRSPGELNSFVEDLLEQMQTRFEDMGNSIMGRMDEMGKRMDELERSIADIMDQAGLEDPPVVVAPATTSMLRTSTSREKSPQRPKSSVEI